MRRRLPAVAVSLAALAALLAAWHLRDAPTSSGVIAVPPAPPAEAIPAPTPTNAPAADAGEPAPQPATSDAAYAPLPPAGAPLADIAATLAARADAGDTAAACRLGAELVRCQAMVWNQPFDQAQLDAIALSAAQNGPSEDLPGLVATAERFREASTHCAGVPPTLHTRAGHYLRQAALAGEAEAMLRYADGDDLFPAGLFRWLRSPYLDPWRRDAPALLERALASGRPEAVLMLARAHTDIDFALGGLVPDDPAQARRWRSLARRLLGDDADTLLADLPALADDPEAQRQADAEAAGLHARLFEGRTWRASELIETSSRRSTADAASPIGTGCGRNTGGDA